MAEARVLSMAARAIRATDVECIMGIIVDTGLGRGLITTVCNSSPDSEGH